MHTRRARAGLALAVLGTALVVLALGWVVPERPRNALAQASVWGALVLASFAGWGSLAHAALAGRTRADLGLRVAWGAALVLWIGAMLETSAAFQTPAAMRLVELGALACVAFAWAQRDAMGATALLLARLVRRNPLLGALGAAMAAYAVVAFLGAASDPSHNPFDDDVAYLPFVKKLLSTGTLEEPFSQRRLAAYGGQTFLHALVSPRARYDQLHVFDHGVALTMVALLVIGHRADGRRARGEVVLLALGLLYAVPSVSVNSASYFSGVAMLFGLYRTLAWNGRGGATPPHHAAMVGLVGAAACTLRQNFLPVVAIMIAAGYVPYALRRYPRGAKELAWIAAVGGAALAPWLVLAWRSGRTFLYPLVVGVGNPELTAHGPSEPWTAQLRYIARCALELQPIHAALLFALGATLLVEKSERRPLRALWLAALLGFLLLTNQVRQAADPWNLSRYTVGFVMALALAVTLTAGAGLTAATSARARAVGPAIVLVALIAELLFARESAPRALDAMLQAIAARVRSAPESEKTQPFEAQLYARAQATVPVGAGIAAMVDDPVHLDFARNKVAILDMPGPSSPAPGLPHFRGAEPVAAYFLARGTRYFAFVRADWSRFVYRRESYVTGGLTVDYWKTAAPYVLDAIGWLEELARSRAIVFEERGLVVLDLASRAPGYERHVATAAPNAGPLPESGDRAATMKALLASGPARAAWDLALQDDVQLGEGWCPLELSWKGGEVEEAHRWMAERASFRVRSHGDRPMKLGLRGVVQQPPMPARTTLTLYLGGQRFESFVDGPDAKEELTHVVVVPAAKLRTVAWLDVTLVLARWKMAPEAACGGYGFALKDVTWTPALATDGDGPDAAAP